VDFYASAVQADDGFITLGGYNEDSGESLQLITKFAQSTYVWSSVRETLATPRHSATTLAVPDTFLNCS